MKANENGAYIEFRKLASTNGKANIIIIDDKIILVSYQTKILELNTATGEIIWLTDETKLSQTTRKHVKSFLNTYTI